MSRKDNCFLHVQTSKAINLTVHYRDGNILRRQGYGIEHMVPRQRQEGDVDAKTDYSEVAVEKPADHLENLRGPRPSVHPGRFGEDQLASAAAAHRRCAPHPRAEAAHLDGMRGGEHTLYPGTFKTSLLESNTLHVGVPPSQCNRICRGNELGK